MDYDGKNSTSTRSTSYNEEYELQRGVQGGGVRVTSYKYKEEYNDKYIHVVCI